MIHRYGPHIFHCPSPRIVTFLSKYTRWIPYNHTVTAEIWDRGVFRHVPFPYCRQTRELLGRELTAPEIIDRFFRDYSRKMWGMEWEELPSAVRGRIPMELAETPVYHRDRFVALPRLGYTHMLENMFDGVELVLGADADAWTSMEAETVVYTGRPDLIPVRAESVSVGEASGLHLGFRTLDIAFDREEWRNETVSLHACTLEKPWTRKTCFARMTGGHSPLISTEMPRQAAADDLTPYYPIETAPNQERMIRLAQSIAGHYPNLKLLGRLGSYRYLDMYQAVGQAMAFAERQWKR